jgi:2-polyprenyl-3-methyl-5-hydroxy-6-metoxy-1,4-benzoquinol methylase
MTSQRFDKERCDAFGDKMVDILNGGSIALMISIGHRTGLFDTMAREGAVTSDDLAIAGGLNERYVREWLGAMFTGKIVEYDPGPKTYELPAEHAAFLTRDAAPDNVAAFTQYIAVLGSVEDKIVDCFENGGGVPYSEFPRFHDVMAEDSGQSVLPALLDQILPLVPGLTKRLEGGIDVLDVGCGLGQADLLMAATFPRSRFTGIDISEEAISGATHAATAAGLENAVFEIRDATDLGYAGEYDLVTTFDAVHDQITPASVLAGIAKSLRPDGVYMMQDIAGSSEVQNNLDHPIGPFLYTISSMHCMTVSLASGGDGFGTMWGKEKALEMLDEAGFGSVSVTQLEHDIQNYYYIARVS